MSNHIILFCTCPDQNTASSIAQTLIGENLAACANIFPGLTSVYRWQDQIETDQECLLLVKTRRDIYPQVEQRIQEAHPYELPEIVAVSVEHALPEYLKWIDSCLSK
ncbi:divalent-cation tolerance protein CutA [Methylotuvimicrobium sp.]|jgi:periplasmic divalent cation tolerance protein